MSITIDQGRNDLTEGQEIELFEAAEIGMSLKGMAGLLGWLDEGKLRRYLQHHPKLAQNIARAKAIGEFNMLRKVRVGGKGVTGAQWVLVYCHGYRQTVVQEITVETRTRTDSEIDQWLETRVPLKLVDKAG